VPPVGERVLVPQLEDLAALVVADPASAVEERRPPAPGRR